MLETQIIDVKAIQHIKTMQCLSAGVLDKLQETVLSTTEEGRQPTIEAGQQVAKCKRLEENTENNCRGPNYVLANGGLGVNSHTRP